METSADYRDARLFFFSKSATRVFYRHLWFGMAGVPEPRHEEMADYVYGVARGWRSL